ncbi:S ribonuclease [Pyrus ussuriensis x Pyrus communis]|uniref:S ribonuclease n=1 Tax=Pyrus ussuriensis x Pyrus communis TaxID=2448454 RepID=A0A5N5EXR8_9ROSA|nr:S ribonuclease [Pyrus ussuriensis x Pyrus communis]
MLSHHHSLFNPFSHMLSHLIIQPHPCTLHDGTTNKPSCHIPSLIIHPPINKHPLQPQKGDSYTLPFQKFIHSNTHPHHQTILRPCATTKRRRRVPKRSYNSSLSCWNV